jgi:FixJ family two-component response regulator
MTLSHPLVCVVDDDESVRESLPDLLRALGYKVEAFASAEDFLSSAAQSRTQCLILDVAMPGMTGPELHRELGLRGQDLPTIFITAVRDEMTRQRLIARGAVDCLFKPFSDAALQRALDSALDT